jgi:hypothetical protein
MIASDLARLGPAARLSLSLWTGRIRQRRTAIDQVAANSNVARGSIWDFTVPDYLIIDTFESSNEDYEHLGCVYQTWIDGAGFTTPINTPGNGSGAAVGHPTWDSTSPYYNRTTVETTLTAAGSTQAMPLYYDNDGPKYYSRPRGPGRSRRTGPRVVSPI